MEKMRGIRAREILRKGLNEGQTRWPSDSGRQIGETDREREKKVGAREIDREGGEKERAAKRQTEGDG